MKPDEKEFLKAIASGIRPRDYIESGRINDKRGLYLLDKWDDKGWYDYGVSLVAGWLTEEGRKEAQL